MQHQQIDGLAGQISQPYNWEAVSFDQMDGKHVIPALAKNILIYY